MKLFDLVPRAFPFGWVAGGVTMAVCLRWSSVAPGWLLIVLSFSVYALCDYGSSIVERRRRDAAWERKRLEEWDSWARDAQHKHGIQ